MCVGVHTATKSEDAMALGAHAMRPKLRVAKQVAACHHTSSSDVQPLKKALKGGKVISHCCVESDARDGDLLRNGRS
jgi:hypothetical protein